MRLLICHERFVFRYGVDRVLLLLAEEFRRLGHHVALLGMHTDAAADGVADRVIRVPSQSFSNFWRIPTGGCDTMRLRLWLGSVTLACYNCRRVHRQ